MKTGGMKKGFKYPSNIKEVWLTNGVSNIQVRYNTELGYEIPEGYRIGRVVEGHSTLGKKWYNNGVINKMFVEGEQEDGFVKGILRKSTAGKNNPNYKGSFERNEEKRKQYIEKKKTCQIKWYTNGVTNTRCFEGEQPDGFFLGISDESKRRRKGKNTWSKGRKKPQSAIDKWKDTYSKRTIDQKISSKEKEFNTKLQNGSLGKTVSEEEKNCYEFLLNKFPNYTVQNQYFDKDRYPHNCDIYIKELDLFIELNFFFTHGNHMPISEEEAIEMDNSMPPNWSGVALSDFHKNQEAIRNKLNYKYFYTPKSFYDFFNLCTFNRITSIEVEDSTDCRVYDIGVKDNDNMVLSNGLVVHNCKPYQYFKSTIYEKRIEMYNSATLIEEIVDLERNINTGKVDHPDGGRKDVCDAVCGALYNASSHAEEFAYDYGESIDLITEVAEDSSDSMRQQITIDFEKALSEIYDPLKSRNIDSKNTTNPQGNKDNNPTNKSPFMDFGFGKAEEMAIDARCIYDGIVVF